MRTLRRSVAVDAGDTRAKAAVGAEAELHDHDAVGSVNGIDQRTERRRAIEAVADQAAHLSVGGLEPYERHGPAGFL